MSVQILQAPSAMFPIDMLMPRMITRGLVSGHLIRLWLIGLWLSAWLSSAGSAVAIDTHAADVERPTAEENSELPARSSAIFAGGCFWCVETDMELAPGVLDVISGYSGGRSKTPTYPTYAAGGHREVVFVVYDPTQITYAGLVEYFIKHIDPLNRHGQFNDKGLQYSPAIYYATEQEQADAERVIEAIDALQIYRGKIGVAVEQRKSFWPAEEYHQDYHRKNGLKYQYFRLASGRDAFVRRHWGERAAKLELPGALPEASPNASSSLNSLADAVPAESAAAEEKPWLKFDKPSVVELRKTLTPLQYKVTQQDGTEPAYRNDLWDNKKEGIYVDVVSGAPLFSSQAKFESGTGWPSFVAPIDNDAVTYKHDRKMFYTRIEVRSRYGDSHLGHVFDDGPAAYGGKRYCMNSAAFRFIPKEQMAENGYADYLKLFGAQE